MARAVHAEFYASDATPVFVGWTDNRNLRSLGGFLTAFTSPLSSAITGAVCNPKLTGTRNQDPYIARAGSGLSAYTLGNQRPLDTTAGVSSRFPERHQRHETFSGADSQPGVRRQRILETVRPAPVAILEISVPPFSMAVRELYAVSNNPDAIIRVNVFEIDANGNTVPNGVQTFTIINPDPTTPDFLSRSTTA